MKSKIRPFFFALLASILLGCASGHLPPSSQHIENNTAISRDTVFSRDSIFIEHWNTVFKNGDTVYVKVREVEYRDRWHWRTQTDTFLAERTDTIMVDVPVEKVVKVTPGWVGWSLLGNALVIVGIGYLVWRRMRRVANR